MTAQHTPATRADVIAGLRQLADYLDHHPGIPVAIYGWDLLAFTGPADETAGCAEVDQIAAALGVPASDDPLTFFSRR